MVGKSSADESPSMAPYQLQSNCGGAAVPDWSEITGRELENDHPEYYMSERMQNRIQNDESLSGEDKLIIQYLACRKFHIPGNTFMGDYIYW